VKADVSPLPVSFLQLSSLKNLEQQNHILLHLFSSSGGCCSLPSLLFFTMDFTKHLAAILLRLLLLDDTWW
jgi:hypothetical protein